MAAKRKPAKRSGRATKAKGRAGSKGRGSAPRAKRKGAGSARQGGAPALPVPKALLGAKREPEIVDVPERSALAIEGEKGPEQEGFVRAIGALYGVAYTLKFARKKARASRDFRIGPLEGRWSAAGAPDGGDFEVAPRETWRWRLRIGVPSNVTEAEVAAAIAAAVAKKGGRLEGSAEARRVTLERVPAATMGRILHVGPYAEEPASFARLRAALASAGLRGSRAHVEVYLSDPMRTEPSKLRTGLLLDVER